MREVRFLVLELLDEIDGVRIALSAAVSSLAPAQVLCVYCVCVCVCVCVIHTHRLSMTDLLLRDARCHRNRS